jgi:uncharacterized FlgJ-related protein
LDVRTVWAAGFFDGEGCISHSPMGGLSLHVTQRIREPLLVLQDLFEGGICSQGKAWQYYVTGKERQEYFLHSLLPYLVVKRSQAELALEYLSYSKGLGTRYTPEQKIRRLEIVKEVKALKRAAG